MVLMELKYGMWGGGRGNSDVYTVQYFLRKCEMFIARFKNIMLLSKGTVQPVFRPSATDHDGLKYDFVYDFAELFEI